MFQSVFLSLIGKQYHGGLQAGDRELSTYCRLFGISVTNHCPVCSLRICLTDRLMIILKAFFQGIPLEWYICLQQLLKIPPPSTARVNFQVCLVPLPGSILGSSTGLRTGSEAALWKQLQRFTGPVLPLGIHNPTAAHGRPCVSVCVLNLHSSLQEACDLHPTSRCTPSQVSQRFNRPRVESAPRPIRTVVWPSPGKWKEHEAPHLQMRS